MLAPTSPNVSSSIPTVVTRIPINAKSPSRDPSQATSKTSVSILLPHLRLSGGRPEYDAGEVFVEAGAGANNTDTRTSGEGTRGTADEPGTTAGGAARSRSAPLRAGHERRRAGGW